MNALLSPEELNALSSVDGASSGALDMRGTALSFLHLRGVPLGKDNCHWLSTFYIN